MKFSQYPKQNLGFFPTPVSHLARLSCVLGGPEILMKRDDLTGLALGGNKTRKLEYILGDAIAIGCDTIITAGASQSNHCRQTAAAAASLGLECHLILGGEAPAQMNGNLLLDKLFNANIHWGGKHRKGEDIPHLFARLQATGKRPYVVPYGGSNELGALAFVNALQELAQQIEDDSVSHIVFASSSGGTHGGLMAGQSLTRKRYQLIGINIDKDENAEKPFREVICEIANQAATICQSHALFSVNDVILLDDYVGSGYGVMNDAEREAIELTARYEGILLDPVYTGRAMAGLIDLIRQKQIGKNDKVLFWHTGGAPALFAYAEQLGQSK
ncbi:D-cysteine desulfhydrase family protein [Aliikangiella maris]|uniref:D-cysteine desulfhydrase family protein n=2 Tax=Aliikangiella maris TaxID=3162458 RepID=A0ABV3MK18_9GAMM